MKRRYDVVPKWFEGKQQPPSKANSSKTDLKKKSITKTKNKTKEFINNVTSR